MAEPPLDPLYFNDYPWEIRAADWAQQAPSPFTSTNAAAIRRVAQDVRVVVNVGPVALLALLRGEPYVNTYERALVGGDHGPSNVRERVDAAVGISGPDTYFGALAVSGVGVRYYGEYCLVLDIDAIDDSPGLFDRDTYEIEYPPFAGRTDRDRLIAQMRAQWDERQHLLLLKVLPTLKSEHRPASTGVLASAVLTDQDFVEVHMRPDRRSLAAGCFELASVNEVRLDPVDLALADWLSTRWSDAELLTDEEMAFIRQRDDVQTGLARAGTRVRVIGGAAGGTRWP